MAETTEEIITYDPSTDTRLSDAIEMSKAVVRKTKELYGSVENVKESITKIEKPFASQARKVLQSIVFEDEIQTSEAQE